MLALKPPCRETASPSRPHTWTWMKNGPLRPILGFCSFTDLCHQKMMAVRYFRPSINNNNNNCCERSEFTRSQVVWGVCAIVLWLASPTEGQLLWTPKEKRLQKIIPLTGNRCARSSAKSLTGGVWLAQQLLTLLGLISEHFSCPLF